jgi:cytoskeleton protein RodZ
MSEQPGDYGRYLQTHRRAKAMSLEVVAQKTKISMTCLRQIENEDGAGLPAPTFVKGFIRAYAEVVGAEPQEALNRYETNIDIHQRQSEGDMAARDTPGAFWGRMLLAFLLLTALIGGTIYFIQRLERPAQSAPMDKAVPLEAPLPLQPPASPDEIPGPLKNSAVGSPATPVALPQVPAPVDVETALPAIAPPEEPTPGEQALREEPTSPVAPLSADIHEPSQAETLQGAQQGPDSQTVARLPQRAAPSPVAPHAKLVLTVTALELSWLRVTSDQGPPREMTLQPGHTATVEARSHFRLLIGNAGGILLALNDQPVSVPGRSGQVVTLQLP